MVIKDHISIAIDVPERSIVFAELAGVPAGIALAIIVLQLLG